MSASTRARAMSKCTSCIGILSKLLEIGGESRGQSWLLESFGHGEYGEGAQQTLYIVPVCHAYFVVPLLYYSACQFELLLRHFLRLLRFEEFHGSIILLINRG